jgi:DNA-binding transcriptional MerR regulator
VGDAELMTVGRFAWLTGLSIHALRHYDDVSLLIPAHTDPRTGYRRYGHDQIRLAHLIRELRWIDLPIEEIRQVLAEAGQAGSVLAGHRQRLLRTRGLLTDQIDNIDRVLPGRVRPALRGDPPHRRHGSRYALCGLTNCLSNVPIRSRRCHRSAAILLDWRAFRFVHAEFRNSGFAARRSPRHPACRRWLW